MLRCGWLSGCDHDLIHGYAGISSSSVKIGIWANANHRIYRIHVKFLHHDGILANHNIGQNFYVSFVLKWSVSLVLICCFLNWHFIFPFFWSAVWTVTLSRTWEGQRFCFKAFIRRLWCFDVLVPLQYLRSSLVSSFTLNLISLYKPLLPAFELATDASRVSWGASMGDLTTQGLWSLHETPFHINVLELMAVKFINNCRFF